MGEGLLSMQRACLPAYQEGLAAGGHDPARARMAGPLDQIVTDDPERTRALLQPHIDYQASAYAVFQDKVARAEGREPFYGGSSSAGHYQVLTPQGAIDFIRDATAGLPVAYVTPWLSVGGMPDKLVEEHITLTTTKVAPALTDDRSARAPLGRGATDSLTR
jgi:hypothetical protein